MIKRRREQATLHSVYLIHHFKSCLQFLGLLRTKSMFQQQNFRLFLVEEGAAENDQKT